MKIRWKLSGIIAILALIMIVMTGCDTGGNHEYAKAIDFTGTQKVGQTLTAVTTGGSWEGNFSWRWHTNPDNQGIAGEIIYGLSGSNNRELFISSELEGRYISVHRWNPSISILAPVSTWPPRGPILP
ncbi:MAG: hypothetical protein FWD26_08550 [Treponema sp.]|nr:hypothetical protein [Treponema sp.]